MQPKEIIIIGYSGHAYVCLDIALLLGYQVLGYCDLNEKEYNPYGLKYLGEEGKCIKENDKGNYFIGIGDNVIRKKIFETNNKKSFANFIHPRAIISSKTQIKSDANTLICAGVMINPLASIAEGAILNTGCIIEHECKIGPFSHIAPGAVLAGNVTVGELSFVGANSVIKQGVTIGNNVIVGAGSVILYDLLESGTYAGNPVRKIR